MENACGVGERDPQRELAIDRVYRNIRFLFALLAARTGGGTSLFLKWRGREQEEADAVTKQVC
jgi:hypothetical protein